MSAGLALAFLLFSQAFLAVPATAPSEPFVGLLAANKKIIPICHRSGTQWTTDVKLPVIIVANHAGAAVAIQRIEVLGMSAGREICRLTMSGEDIRSMISDTAPLLNRLLGGRADKWKAYNLKKLFGVVPAATNKFALTAKLGGREHTAIDLSGRFHLLHQGPQRLEALVIRVGLEADGRALVRDLAVNLTHYSCRGDYVFPLAGGATLEGVPFGLSGHRGLPSSEFAFDAVEYRRLGDDRLSTSAPEKSSHAADYFIFHRDVLAVGDGVVVKTGNGWPDAWMENPLRYAEQRIYDLTVELIDKGVEFENAYLGNYVVIDHRNGEYSAYVHLSQNTLCVKPGDAVRRGQVIAKVGNTANSTEPHLHFQLMDSPDYPSANGLPVMFRNVPLPLPGALAEIDDCNTLFSSNFLHLFVKKAE